MNTYAQRPEKTTSEKDSKTNIPRGMKAGFERSSGFSFDDVKVHYNSEKPAQLRAHAYTQGNNVYVAPGQEKHLPHELGHVVQQKSDMVEPNGEIEGLPLNDDEVMENDADEKAEEAEDSSDSEDEPLQAKFMDGGVVQRENAQGFYNISSGLGGLAAVAGFVGGIGSFWYTKHKDRKHSYIDEIEKYADAACEACDEQIAAADMYNAPGNGPEERNKAHAEAIKQRRKVKRNFESAIKKAGTMDTGVKGDHWYQIFKKFDENNVTLGTIGRIKDKNVKNALTKAFNAYQTSIAAVNNPAPPSVVAGGGGAPPGGGGGGGAPPAPAPAPGPPPGPQQVDGEELDQQEVQQGIGRHNEEENPEEQNNEAE